MDNQQISLLVQTRAFNKQPLEISLKETHISWIILTDEFAFKIKKPVKFSFLDFSSLEKRRFYCEQEVSLNQRLAGDTYIGVIPIRYYQGGPFMDAPEGRILDYAVKMKRLDNQREMGYLLEKKEVTKVHLRQVAEQLASFHAFADVMTTVPNIKEMQDDFADIMKVKTFAQEVLGDRVCDKIDEAVNFSKQFLQIQETAIQVRHKKGFIIDGHGDLHSGNIFLLEEPVIFDCIEFNPHFRTLDILNELAFFCMDLDFYGREDLAVYFMQEYNRRYPVIFNKEDRLLFQYYKMYRANVRFKVNMLGAMQATTEKERVKYLGLAEDYFQLFKRYLELLKEKQTSTNEEIVHST